MIYLDQLAAIFLLMVVYTLILVVLGYYLYKNYYLPSLEQGEPSFIKDIKELTDNISKGFTETLGAVKVDIDMNKIAETITQNTYGTFLAVLGVNLEKQEEIDSFSFKTYIKEIIDSSVETIVPETIKQFEAILPEFADSFIEGIQKALSGAVANMPEGSPQQAAAQQVQGVMPDLDIGKMIQMVFMQQLMKMIGGGGFNLGSMLGSATGSAPPQSSGF